MKSDSRFIDPSTIRKDTIVKDKLTFVNNIPIFSILEFNIYGNCNRNCSFCPVSDPIVYEKKQEGITVDLYNKILDDLAIINYSGKILFSAFCEPLLHKEIYLLIANTREKLPLSRIEIVSNGDLLTKNKLNKLFEAGLDSISISMYDGAQQIEYFTSMYKEIGLTSEQVLLRRRYYENGNYGITISNRSGLVNSNEYRDENEEEIIELPVKSKCYYPFYMILIDYNGDVLLCPHDWSRKINFGNVNKENILEIWNSNKLNHLRAKLSNKDRSFFPCNKCDVLGTVMGEDSYEAWINTGLIQQ